MRLPATMKSCFHLFLSLLLLCSAAWSAEGGDDAPDLRWRAGDGADWAQHEFDDSDWAIIDTLPERPDGIFWVRYHFAIDEHFKPPANSVLNVSGAGAFDVYLDGVLLGSSGVVGETLRKERPGAIRFNLAMPRAFLSVGEHVLAVRASAHHLRDPADFFITYQLQSADGVYTRNFLNLVMLPPRQATSPSTRKPGPLLDR